jgi:hypothetical protein
MLLVAVRHGNMDVILCRDMLTSVRVLLTKGFCATSKKLECSRIRCFQLPRFHEGLSHKILSRRRGCRGLQPQKLPLSALSSLEPCTTPRATDERCFCSQRSFEEEAASRDPSTMQILASSVESAGCTCSHSATGQPSSRLQRPSELKKFCFVGGRSVKTDRVFFLLAGFSRHLLLQGICLVSVLLKSAR